MYLLAMYNVAVQMMKCLKLKLNQIKLTLNSSEEKVSIKLEQFSSTPRWIMARSADVVASSTGS